MRITAVAAAACLAAVIPGRTDGYCYRMACSTSSSCQGVQAQTEGRCCCKVSCQGGQGGPSCACTTWCTTSCLDGCTACGGCDGGGEGAAFVYTPELYDALLQEHPLSALVLRNLSSRGSLSVGSTVAEGKADLAGGAAFGYRVAVAADESFVTLRYAFEEIDEGPRPEPVQVELDVWGAVETSPLSDDEARKVLESVSSTCGGGAAAR